MQKSKWTYNADSFTATRPLTAEYCAECATPGATLTLSHTEAKGKKMKVKGQSDDNGGVSFQQDPAGSETTISQDDYTQGVGISIGNDKAESESDLCGQIFKITATATKGDADATAYEVAYRSVIYIMGLGQQGGSHNEFKLHKENNYVANALGSEKCGLWIRGGESMYSDSTTPELSFELEHGRLRKNSSFDSNYARKG